jgi:hypothetical protein
MLSKLFMGLVLGKYSYSGSVQYEQVLILVFGRYQFEPWPEQLPSLSEIFVVFLIPSRKIPG